MAEERRIRIRLVASGVSGHATLLEHRAPETCNALWAALPLEGPFFHAKWENNCVYTVVEPIAAFGAENQTVFPIPGDLLCNVVPHGESVPVEVEHEHARAGSMKLALFYGRDNYLLGPMGHMPGSLFALVNPDDLGRIADACARLWREGHAHERLRLEKE